MDNFRYPVDNFYSFSFPHRRITRAVEKPMKPKPPISIGNTPRPSRPDLPNSSIPDLAIRKKIEARATRIRLRLIVTDNLLSFTDL